MIDGFNPDWTLEQADAANQAALDADPARSSADPTLPLSRWIGARVLEQFQEAYASGDKFALMNAIRECARCDLLLPEWVATAYLRAIDEILNYRAQSWDEVFGRPIPKGAHIAALRKRRDKKFAVWLAVIRAVKADPNLPIDTHLFDTIGKRLGLGGTLAQEYYEAVIALGLHSGKDAKRALNRL